MDQPKGQPTRRQTLQPRRPFYLLRNKTYFRLIPHGEDAYPGQHTAIVPEDLFAEVQASFDAQNRRKKAGRRTAAAPLTGKLVDAASEPMTPTHARGKTGRIYRYYVSSSLLRRLTNQEDGANILRRISARAIEGFLQRTLEQISGEPMGWQLIERVALEPQSMLLTLASNAPFLDEYRTDQYQTILSINHVNGQQVIRIRSPFSSQEGRTDVETTASEPASPDPAIVAALRKAHRLLEWDRDGLLFTQDTPSFSYQRRLIKFALLAPDVQHTLLTQVPHTRITLKTLLETKMPLSWDDQRRLILGEKPHLTK